MTNETENPAPVEPEVVAPVQDVTDTPAIAETVPEEQALDDAPVAKSYTQDELEAIVEKRLARERRKLHREQVRAPEPVATPPADDYDPLIDPEAYAEALARSKLQGMIAEREAATRQAALVESYMDREEEARDRYDDFQQVVYDNRDLVITDAMLAATLASDIGPDIAYWLGTNTKEARRIAGLSQFAQAKEIGRIEAVIGSNGAKEKSSSVTNAPPPLAPVRSAKAANVTVDTTRPDSMRGRSTSEWIALENERVAKRLRSG